VDVIYELIENDFNDYAKKLTKKQKYNFKMSEFYKWIKCGQAVKDICNPLTKFKIRGRGV